MSHYDPRDDWDNDVTLTNVMCHNPSTRVVHPITEYLTTWLDILSSEAKHQDGWFSEGRLDKFEVGNITLPRETVRHLLAAYQQAQQMFVDDVPCDFEGDVEAVIYGNGRTAGTIVWNCPACGHENETDPYTYYGGE